MTSVEAQAHALRDLITLKGESPELSWERVGHAIEYAFEAGRKLGAREARAQIQKAIAG